MEVSSVTWAEKRNHAGNLSAFPYTFFKLSPSEQLKYNSFRVEHDRLNEILEGKKPQERDSLERQVHQIFADLISPYLSKHGMKVEMCLRTEGSEKDTLVTCREYKVFDKDESFDLSFETVHWFSTNSKNLYCRSHLAPLPSPISGILEDLVRICIKSTDTDGKTSPIAYLNNGVIQFASIEFAVPIIEDIKRVLEQITKGKIDELQVLHNEYLRYLRSSREKETIEGRVFKEAYREKLDRILRESGLMKGKLEAVK